ncbi:MAG: radical SAM protein [Nitriliruptoraceae bacterium]
MADLNVVMKNSRLCNLRCSYCTDWRAGPGQTMTFEVMASAIDFALQDPHYERITFNWHGGEPTLLPTAFYEQVLQVQARLRHPHQLITNTMQSNGTRLTPELIRFLERNAFALGISLDGPQEIHDRYRVTAAGGPTFERVLDGIRLLSDAGVPVSAIMVVSDDVLAAGADRVFDTFLSLGLTSFALNPVRPVNQPLAPPATPTRNYADPPRYTAFLRRLVDRWIEHGDPRIRIREVTSLLQRLRSELPQVCTLAGGCFGLIYRVDPDGLLAHCGHFDGDERFVLGNVLTDDLPRIVQGDRFAARVRDNERELEQLRGCPEFAVCNGWCPHDRYLSARHNPDHSSTCCGLSDLIGHLRARLDDVQAMSTASVDAAGLGGLPVLT